MTKHTLSATERCARYMLEQGRFITIEELRDTIGIPHRLARQILGDLQISGRYDCICKYVIVKKGPRNYHCRAVKVTAIRPDKKQAIPVRATSLSKRNPIVKEYPSAYSTEVEGFDPTSVLLAARGKTKDNSHGGFKWEFINGDQK